MANYYKHIVVAILLVLTHSLQAQVADRKELFDRDWRFSLGSMKDAEDAAYDDANWRLLSLPHDWSIEPLQQQVPGKTLGPFSKESSGGAATGQTLGGEGWYRKAFTILPKDAGKRHELYFEGIYNQSEIWVNGKKAYENVYGYSTFRFDITKYCNPVGKKNTIAVKVLNIGKNSRWYSGSGIYRHVWMIKTATSYLDDWGTFIRTTALNDKDATVAISTKLIHGFGNKKKYGIHVKMVAPDGKVAATAEQFVVPSTDTFDISFKLLLKQAKLWSPENPNLYTLSIALFDGKSKLDELSIPFGVRTIAFSVDKGFELNGNSMKLKGGCIHHDNGLLGAAAFDRAEERKVSLLKQNGFNAIRASHNPMSESFMAACDRLGMLVIDEAFDQWKEKKNDQDYHLYFDQWSAKDIKSLVLRDRNRASVIMWSIGNEIRERASEKGLAIAGYLKKEIQQYDSTRPITAGVNKYWDKEHRNMLPLDNAFHHLDVSGYNYMWRFYEADHAKFPQRIIFGSESVAIEAAPAWDMVEKHDYVIGDFVWAAMDYLGESGIGNSIEVDPKENVHQFMDWPWFNGWCGDLDILGNKKPQSYYRDVLWRKIPISMAVEKPVPEGKIRKVSFWGWAEETLSWTFPGMENKSMKVNVYSRSPKVKLYLNDVLMNEKSTDEQYKVSFELPYQAGVLKAVAINENGAATASTVLETNGEPVALRLTADSAKLKANGQGLSYVLIELVDKKENLIYDSNRKINLSLKGICGTIIASGSASPNDMESFGSSHPKLFNGRAMVIIRSGYKKGELELLASSEGMKVASIKITVN